MSDLRELMRKATEHARSSPDALERTMNHVRRRERRRKISTVAVAFALFTASAVLLGRGFRAVERPAVGSREAPTTVTPSLDPHLVATIRLGNRWDVSSVAFGFGSAWVGGHDEEGEFLVRVDAATNEISARIPAAGAGWLEGGGGLAVGFGALCAAGGGPAAAVLQRIDPATDTVVTTVDLGPGSGVDVAVTDTDLWVLVNEWENEDPASRLVRVNPGTAEIMATVELGLGWVRRILATEAAIWVAGAEVTPQGGIGTPHLVMVDPQLNQIARSFPTAFFPIAVDGDILWATSGNPSNRALVRLDAMTGEVVGEPIPIAEGVGDDLVVGAGGVWFASSGAPGGEPPTFIHRFNPVTGSVDISIPGSSGPIDMALSADSLWLLNFDGTLTRIDLS